MFRLAIITSLLLCACTTGASDISIADVQGRGSSSPFEGETVTVSGIVSGDFQDADGAADKNLGGFYLQSESPDDDPLTSDGIFVFDADTLDIDVATGDRLEVTGTVKEHFGETQIVATRIVKSGKGRAIAIEMTLPAAQVAENSDGDFIADLEAFEGMLVRIPTRLVVANLRHLQRFGEIGVAAGARPQQFTNTNLPDTAAYARHKQETAARSIILDDGLRRSPEGAPRYLLHDRNGNEFMLRAGDSVGGLVGNLRYSRGSGGAGPEGWRLVPTEAPQFRNDNPRPAAPDIEGQLRVASFNLLNFFAVVDNGRPVCGPRSADNCRGADSALELQRQTDKLVTALLALDADIIGVVEIDNDGGKTLDALTEAVNDRLGKAVYQNVATGPIGSDTIGVGLLFRAGTVTAVGRFAVLDNDVDGRFNAERNRPVLAQTFATKETGARFTIAIAHLKSKGSDCEAEGDPNRNDGQGNCNGIRTDAASAMADWLRSDPTDSGDADFLLLGDLNAYSREDPVRTLQDAGLINLLAAAKTPYSFLFDGQIGALDHALASASLARQVVDIIEWHINADEAPLLDYNLEHGRDPTLFDAQTPFRASDHDPVVIGLNLDP